MTSTALILIILGSIFLGLGVIFLVIFNVIFLLKKHYINVDYKLKNKYNYYHNSTIGNSIKSIESIASKNIKLMPILNFIINYRITYEKQLEIVKVKLRSLSNLLKTFKLREIHRAINQIKYNFDQLDKQQEEYKKINLDTQKYSNNVSGISTELFDVISLISNFNKDNMINIFYKDVNDFNIINKKVNEISLKINEQLELIDSPAAHRLFLEEWKLANDYLDLSKKIYEINEFHLALDTIINEVKTNYEALENNENNIIFYKKIKIAKNKSNTLIKEINASNIKEKTNEYIKEIKSFEKELKDIKVSCLLQEIIKNNIPKYEKCLNDFFRIINEHRIKDLCKEILIRFKDDEAIKELAKNDITIATEINNALNKQEELNINNFDSEEKYLKSIHWMINIYELMIRFKENNEALFSKIKHKNIDLLALTFSINDANLKLSQIQLLLEENKITNQEISTKINQYQQLLKTATNELVNNILHNTDKIKESLSSINDFIEEVLYIVKNKKEVIAIAKQLKMYANRFMTKNNASLFKEFNELWQEEKYYDLIETYIEFISRAIKNKKVA